MEDEDIPGDSSTTAEVEPGSVVSGTIHSNGPGLDHDWYRIDLIAGQGIGIAVDGSNGLDAYLEVRDQNGIILAEDDDSGGGNGDSLLYFNAPATGTYFIAIRSYLYNGGSGVPTHGDYTLSVTSPDGEVSGTPGDDVLDGGLGGDRMVGGAGDDTYIVDSEHDQTIEFPDEGTDEVRSSVTWSLAPNTENLTITGFRPGEAIDAFGNELGNVIVGNNNNNFIDGGAGADTMSGGGNDDTYIVDNVGDVVIESIEGDTDVVYSSVSFTLSTNLESLFLTGGAEIDGTGNADRNLIEGNEAGNDLRGMGGADRLHGGGGNDFLDGGAGGDIMEGGTGNDIYVVDSESDAVRETAVLGGLDTVQAFISFSLNENVENLTLLGGTAGSGNELDNLIVGNSSRNRLKGGAGNDTLQGLTGDDFLVGGTGADTLDGGQGADIMDGGAGDDTYEIDSTGDAVNENASEGTDTVRSTISFSLGANVENLTLRGDASINGSGNDLNNVIVGKTGANTLKGGAGKDMLFGGLGTDTLNGGTGADKFVFDTALGGTNFDRIVDFSSIDDTIWLDQSIFSALDAGVLEYGAFRPGSTAVEADDRILFDSATGKIRYDADGTGSIEPITFALVAPGTTVTNFDFFVI